MLALSADGNVGTDWRRGRVAEGTSLLRMHTAYTCIVGSNPTVSAIRKASNHAGLLAFSFAKRLEPTDCFSLFSPEHGENLYCAASPKPFNIASAEEILEL